MNALRNLAAAWLARGEPAVLVEVSEALGSAPREAGARMLVSATRCEGTIGGGHLELKAIARARQMLASVRDEFASVRAELPSVRAELVEAPGEPRTALRQAQGERGGSVSVHYPLGPALGQCCGGAVTLAFSRLDAKALAAWPLAAPRFHLQLYGAGHVGRAIVRALAPLNVRVAWIDERDDQFPPAAEIPAHTRVVAVDAPEAEVDEAPKGAFFLVLTHRHDLDLRISTAILKRDDFAFFGLIGSKTKRARFIHRFEVMGLAPEAIARLTCPIGVPGVEGKEPEVIAASVVAQLLVASSRAKAQTPASARSAATSSTFTV